MVSNSKVEISKDDPIWIKLDNLFTLKHESFSISPSKPEPFNECKDHVKNNNSFVGPGFFFIFDQDCKYVRCGVMKDIQEHIKKLHASPTDIYMNISVAWWYDDMGYSDMRLFKQSFKRCLK